jgi:hypothetical protein
MTELEDIEKAIADLSPEELTKLRAVPDELKADLWDAQIERDAKAGKLDKLEAKARANYAAGDVTDL